MKKTNVFYDVEFNALLERQGSTKKIYDRMESQVKEYKEQRERRNEIYRLLDLELSESGRDLLFELDELFGSELSHLQTSAYIQGVKDTEKKYVNPMERKLKRVK